MRRQKNILVTGPPGSGKTTLIRKLAAELALYGPSGFFTQEIREHGTRKGFGITGLDGSSGVLSHVDIRGRDRVGRYGVDVAGFDRFLQALSLVAPGTRFAIIDEIGKMECLSASFRRLVTALLDSEIPVIATIALAGTPFIEELKGRPDVVLRELTERDRDRLLADLADQVRTLLGA